jgi:hypothetical protein
MATTDSGVGSSGEHTPFPLRTKYVPAPLVRELPAMPASTWRIIGPGIVAAGAACRQASSFSGRISLPR